MTRRILAGIAVVAALVSPALVHAQSARVTAPVDVTGYWVSMIVDEWRFRVTPQKGDILYLPLGAKAREIATRGTRTRIRRPATRARRTAPSASCSGPAGCTSRGTASRR